MAFDRLPALPLIANDPYFSIWLPADLPTDANTIHWAGAQKWIRGHLTVDGRRYRYLGKNGVPAVQTTGVKVTPTQTIFEMTAGPVDLKVTFWTPALPDDFDVMSTPITFVDYAVKANDGAEHEVSIQLSVPDTLCFDGVNHPEMFTRTFTVSGLNIASVGQTQQKILCHSGDHITIDWGYMYMASKQNPEYEAGNHAKAGYVGGSLLYSWKLNATAEEQKDFVMLAYDDIASVNYFGTACKAWYARNGANILDAMLDFDKRHDELFAACCELDERVWNDSVEAADEDYAKVTAAAWRHTIAAHKLIATPKGEMAFLSKENDSNGCIGTVDVSYPSTPMLLKYCPELVNALSRPILEFAQMPVWEYDFAPHDVGRYPYVTGQVYDCAIPRATGNVIPPIYLYPAGSGVFHGTHQMPVEESGNMLVMLETAITFGADDSLARQYMDTLATWVHYLDEYGEDPANQLCTDDFAGHLAHNVNLSAKAIVGIACYGRLLKRFGQEEEAARWTARAHELMESWKNRVVKEDGVTPLTFNGIGWSMKYNLAWDQVLGLNLMPEEFYRKETEGYVKLQNKYGLPLDSRDDYSKSDWIAWTASLAPDKETRIALLKPLSVYLRETQTRVPFSDWYNTRTGDFVEFIARSVQGGLYMPILKK